MKDVLILGSTGSIGRNALEVIAADRDNFRVLGLSANRNIALLKKQIKKFKPAYVWVADSRQGNILKKSLSEKVKLFCGPQGMDEFSSLKSDIALMGIVGISSLAPLLKVIKSAKRVALASKEALVAGGDLVMKTFRKYRTQIIPVDSEINAVFQLFGVLKPEIKKIYLTASGGALFDYSKSRLAGVKKKDVLAHPTWSMGQRITVDCATLLNKGFEVMECHHIFGVDYDKIDIIIHRQSFAHAMVTCGDNMTFACVYPPDMRLPIAFSLYYPERYAAKKGSDTAFNSRQLSFEKIKYGQFPLLNIVLDAAREGGNLPAIINAADEIAVECFLKGRIGFNDIIKVVRRVFAISRKKRVGSLEDILYWDEWSRNKTKECINKLCG